MAFEGYSATMSDGGVLYPWMTRRECQHDAKAIGKRAAVFADQKRTPFAS